MFVTPKRSTEEVWDSKAWSSWWGWLMKRARRRNCCIIFAQSNILKIGTEPEEDRIKVHFYPRGSATCCSDGGGGRFILGYKMFLFISLTKGAVLQDFYSPVCFIQQLLLVAKDICNWLPGNEYAGESVRIPELRQSFYNINQTSLGSWSNPQSY